MRKTQAVYFQRYGELAMQTTPCQNIHPMLGACRTLEIGGVLIHWVSVGKGPLVLFVHGSQAWSYAWHYQINAFAAASY